MKVEIEIRTGMSRAETFKALQIAMEAAQRLAHRMTERQLDKLANYGAALIATAENERAGHEARRLNRIAAGPPLTEKIAQ